MPPVHATSLTAFPLFRRGKVRDVYDLGDRLMMVATDRISAFDVVMNEPIPDKGALLTQISAYWFATLGNVVPNHLLSTDVDTVDGLSDAERAMLRGRTMIVRKTRPLPIECVVRGYLAGSGWKEYSTSRTVCGISLPDGYVESSKLAQPIFTPATKAEEGHDENISFERAVQIVGIDVATRVRDLSLALFEAGGRDVAAKGLILADTKFEFGLLDDGSVILIDEALTPDSSRYWLAADYEPGKAQHNFDKQILRDWLETCDWNKQAPPPRLPQDVIDGTRAKYIEAYMRITGADAWKPTDA
ncbi:MAG: phosphoribosylaminoimidazolesuccinocarboxamide synthase [Candidatus Kapabacteria bacterium]|nr:phosphoribosylaminoimidazolesuccinocarboxamide synthase [Candidatus Kapabacteria bacterium]